MAYENFIPTVWAKGIERDLERMHVFAADTNRNYEGDVKGRGDSVKILGVGKPTITTTNEKDITLSDPETVADTSLMMPINQIAYFNYTVGDIDKAQSSEKGIMEALSEEANEGIADAQDKYIANLAKASEAVFDSDTAYQVTKANVLEKIDGALQKLYENDVKPTSEITMTVSPRFYMLLKQAYVALDTDNSKMLENGRVGRYGNVIVRMSNNVATASSGAADLIQVKTKRAIAFAQPLIHTEAYRPEKKFADAVKGFVLYDAKIVRPKEMIVMNVKYTA